MHDVVDTCKRRKLEMDDKLLILSSNFQATGINVCIKLVNRWGSVFDALTSGPALGLEPQCTIAEHNLSFGSIEWLEVARFAAIGDSTPGVEKDDDLVYRFSD